MKLKLTLSISLFALASLCAAKDAKTPDPKGKAPSRHAAASKGKPAKPTASTGLHFPWFHKATRDVWVPPEVETVGVGRTVKNGKLIEAHRETRIVADGHFNTNLPRGPVNAQKGPQGPYTPPNFVPPPESQRLSDSERAADEARQQLEAAANRANNQVDEANVLGPQIAELTSENNNLRAQLQVQVDQAMHAKGTEAPTGPSSQPVVPPSTRTDAQQTWSQLQAQQAKH